MLFKIQNKYEAVMAKSISSVAQKIMGGQQAKWIIKQMVIKKRRNNKKGKDVYKVRIENIKNDKK